MGLLLFNNLLLEAKMKTLQQAKTIFTGIILLFFMTNGLALTHEQGGAIAGGIAGGVIGNQIGNGTGKTAATIVGAITGTLIGSQWGKSVDAS